MDIKFYRFLLAFNRTNTLRSRPATEEWLKVLGTPDSIKADVEEQISTLLVQEQGYSELIKEVSIHSLDFQDGTVHDVNENTQFAELHFKASLRLVVEPYLQSVWYQNIFAPIVHTVSPTGVSVPAKYSEFVYETTIPEAAALNTVPARVYTATGQSIRHTTLSAELTVSARVQNGTVSGIEIDKFNFEPSDDPLFGLTIVTRNLV